MRVYLTIIQPCCDIFQPCPDICMFKFIVTAYHPYVYQASLFSSDLSLKSCYLGTFPVDETTGYVLMLPQWWRIALTVFHSPGLTHCLNIFISPRKASRFSDQCSKPVLIQEHGAGVVYHASCALALNMVSHRWSVFPNSPQSIL